MVTRSGATSVRRSHLFEPRKYAISVTGAAGGLTSRRFRGALTLPELSLFPRVQCNVLNQRGCDTTVAAGAGRRAVNGNFFRIGRNVRTRQTLFGHVTHTWY